MQVLKLFQQDGRDGTVSERDGPFKDFFFLEKQNFWMEGFQEVQFLLCCDSGCIADAGSIDEAAAALMRRKKILLRQ